MQVFDSRPCELGEGAFWHPERRQLFWFDILQGRLLSQDDLGARQWQFPWMASAAGWLSDRELLIAGETGLHRFDLHDETLELLAPLEADNPRTRSNDGRADRQGGFWIGTMAKAPAERKGAGAIYRYYRGELRKLFPGISIPNSICFAPDGTSACFSDTMAQTTWRVALDDHGWPKGEPQVFLDHRGTAIYPDGAVMDAEGNVWNAQWGSARVACYSPAGRLLRAVAVAAPHTSCPAFGGAELTTLYCTTALEEMTEAAKAASPQAGMTFAEAGVARGLAEPMVLP